MQRKINRNRIHINEGQERIGKDIGEHMSKKVSVQFRTADSFYQKIYDMAEERIKKNIAETGEGKLMLEGGGYAAHYPKGLPLEGLFYANRDMDVAVDAQRVWFKFQRADGRMSGELKHSVQFRKADADVPDVLGFMINYACFVEPLIGNTMLDVYRLADLDHEYLRMVYEGLEKWDNYLWTYRDSDGDGCLELWCESDTGDDYAVRYDNQVCHWGMDYPPKGFRTVPMESIDMMASSYHCRQTNAQIAQILGNGKAKEWEAKAEYVKAKVHDYLWREDKNACYDRDADNEFIEELTSSNIRAMYSGLFTQDMAERFISKHLLNPEEFWTALPVPSVAVNDAGFRTDDTVRGYNGQTPGINFLYSIVALERYGYPVPLIELSRKLNQIITEEGYFCSFYNTLTGKPTGEKLDVSATAPMLAVLAMAALHHGIAITPKDEIYFSVLDDGFDTNYTQVWGEDTYTLSVKSGIASAYKNEKLLFKFESGFRVVTALDGTPKRVIRLGKGAKHLSFDSVEKELMENEAVIF